MCQTRTPFEISLFLREVIADRIMPVNAYNKQKLKEAEQGKENEFSRIIEYCLKLLKSNQLLTETHLPTQRLKSICPLVNRILMPGIRPLLDAEKEIRRDPNYSSMIRLLKELKETRILNQYSVGKFIDPTELSKLARLGMVTLYMDGRLKMTTLGKLALPLLE